MTAFGISRKLFVFANFILIFLRQSNTVFISCLAKKRTKEAT